MVKPFAVSIIFRTFAPNHWHDGLSGGRQWDIEGINNNSISYYSEYIEIYHVSKICSGDE